MSPRKKKCKSCGDTFQPFDSLAVACSMACALDLVDKKKLDDKKKELKKRKEKIKTLGEKKKEFQAVFNRFIRIRDKDQPCISCGSFSAGQYHAGHYRSVGACPELRFCELNVHKQCAQCNNFKSGAVNEYRINLVKRIGVDQVDWLEGPHDPLRITKADCDEGIRMYRAKIRKLEDER